MTDFTYLLKFAGFTMLWGMALIGMYFVSYYFKKKRSNKRFEEAKYNCLYMQIQRLLAEDPSEANKEKIRADRDYLSHMEHKNKEKTQTIYCEWLRKYYEAELTTDTGE